MVRDLSYGVRLGLDAWTSGQPDGGEAATFVVAEPGALGARATVEAARELRRVVPAHVPIVLAGRVDVTAVAQLDGVLLVRDELSPADARRILGAASLVGILVTEPAHADELYRWSVDFAVVSGATGSRWEAPDVYLLGRIRFRATLSSPATAILAATGPDEGERKRLLAAGAAGIIVPSPPTRTGNLETAVGDALASGRIR